MDPTRRGNISTHHLLTPGRGYFPIGVRRRAGPWFGYKTRDSAMSKEPGADTQSFAAAEKPRADRSDRQVKNRCDFFASHALQSDQQNNSTLLIGELGDRGWRMRRPDLTAREVATLA